MEQGSENSENASKRPRAATSSMYGEITHFRGISDQEDLIY